MPYMCHFQVCSMAFWIPLDATLKPCNGWTSCRLSQLDGNGEDLTLESLTPSRFLCFGEGMNEFEWNIEISLIIHPSHWPVPSKMFFFVGGGGRFRSHTPQKSNFRNLKKKELRISRDFQNLATIFKFQPLNFRGVLAAPFIYTSIRLVGAPTKQVLWRSAPASRPSLRYWHLYLKISWCWNTPKYTTMVAYIWYENI